MSRKRQKGIWYTHNYVYIQKAAASQRKITQKEAEKRKTVVPTSIKSGVYYSLSSVNVSVCAYMLASVSE